MRVPKPKHKTVQSHRLSTLDGVKDVQVGPASVDNRQRRDFSKTGLASQRDDSDFADIKARNERFGPFNF